MIEILRLLEHTKLQLKSPTLDKLERKLNVDKSEKFFESSYFSDEMASLYFFWNPIEGPFMIIPSMEGEGKTAGYRLTGIPSF